MCAFAQGFPTDGKVKVNDFIDPATLFQVFYFKKSAIFHQLHQQNYCHNSLFYVLNLMKNKELSLCESDFF
jgi:hypothetical protein